MNSKVIFVIFISIIFFFSCSSQKTTSENYEKPDLNMDNTTSVVETPGGVVRIPGLWKPFHYDKSSRQNFLKDKEGVIIGVAQNSLKSYPFYNNKMRGYEFIKTYTNWDLDYQNQNGNKAEIIKSDIENEYQIWKYKDNKQIVNVFLYGINKNYVLNLLVYTNDWEEEKTINFLTETYNLNKNK